jgi:uncharacterized metal-binding protein
LALVWRAHESYLTTSTFLSPIILVISRSRRRWVEWIWTPYFNIQYIIKSPSWFFHITFKATSQNCTEHNRHV